MRYRFKNTTSDDFFKIFQSYEEEMLETLQGKNNISIREYTDNIIMKI
ncbi:hypothetical protein [Sphingobacterium pedocola]|nr:hypothetical protein [Sphingobacterium pedocola]